MNQANSNVTDKNRGNRPFKLQVHLDQPTREKLFSEALQRSHTERRSVSVAEVARELLESGVNNAR